MQEANLNLPSDSKFKHLNTIFTLNLALCCVTEGGKTYRRTVT